MLIITLACALGLGLALYAPGNFFAARGIATTSDNNIPQTGPLFFAGAEPNLAYAVTSAEKQAEADEMLRRLDELQTELNQINEDYINASIEHEAAMAKMIDAQQREAAAELRIQELQSELGNRAQHMYKQGPGSFLDVIFGAKSFTEFITAVDLMNRVNERDAELVAESKIVRQQAEAARIEYTEMERVTAEKEAQLADLKLQKENMAIEMHAQAQQLAAEAENLRIEEEAAAEQARLLAEELARKTANGGTPVDPAQLGKVPPLTHPCPNYTAITSPFGFRTFDNTFHKGTDLAAPTGTPIYAAASGTVIYAGWENMGGNVVYMTHGNGVVTVYGHASSLLVSTGQQVEAGEKIALVGSTGYATGPHLHFQIEIDGTAVDSMIFL
jgi:murein DD-endopeptidase MepM/ murein hydrolase activator NlpD